MEESIPFSTPSTGKQMEILKSSVFPFLRLPVEIQYKICCQFCPHCLELSPLTMLFCIRGSSFKTLKTLSESCFTLHKIAQPIMYHCIDTKSYYKLFRTLLDRPDLAASVRVFPTYHPYNYHNCFMDSTKIEENRAFLAQMVRKLRLGDNPRDPNLMQYVQFLHGSGRLADYYRPRPRVPLKSEATFRSITTAMYILLLRKLEFIRISLADIQDITKPYNEEDDSMPYYYLSWGLISNSQGFPSIATVAFRHNFPQSAYQTNYDSVRFLFRFMPNVKQLIFDFSSYCGDDRDHQESFASPGPEPVWPMLPQVEEIYMYCYSQSHSPTHHSGIYNLLRSTNASKRLVLSISSQRCREDVFSPRAFLQTILPAIGSLQHLELYCNSCQYERYRFPPCIQEPLTGGLRNTYLTTLVLDEALFCHHWLMPDIPSDSCLIGILPCSIKHVTIRLCDKYAAVPDIVRVGREASDGCLPNLSHFNVDVLDQHPNKYDRRGDGKAYDILRGMHSRFCMTRRYAPPCGIVATHIEEFTEFDDQLCEVTDEFLLYKVPRYEWESTIRTFTNNIRRSIEKAFENTSVITNVRYMDEFLIPLRESHYI